MRSFKNVSRTVRVLAFAAFATVLTSAEARDITVYVDGEAVQFMGTGPRMLGDRVVVPLRGVFERLGANVDWNESDQSITATKQARKIWLRIGDQDATVDGSNVHLDQPAIIYRGTTMVPLRFVSESLGADVKWNDSLQTVNISTGIMVDNDRNNDRDNHGRDNRGNGRDNRGNGRDNTGNNGNNGQNWRMVTLDSGTVIPVTLNNSLSSNTAREGDKFSATVDTKGNPDYAGLPRGSTVVGHVSLVKQRTDKDPGVLGLDYDAVVLPNGTRFPVSGSQIGLDDKSVEVKDGVVVARKTANSNDHKNVWIGAGAGAVLAVITKGNILTDTVVGAALGYLYDTLHLGGNNNNKDVNLKAGTEFGVRLDQDLVARIGR